MTKRSRSRNLRKRSRNLRKRSKSRSKRKFSKKKTRKSKRRKSKRRSKSRTRRRRSFSFNPLRKRSRSDSLVKKMKNTQSDLEEEIYLLSLLKLKESIVEEKERAKCYLKSLKVRGKDVPENMKVMYEQVDDSYDEVLFNIDQIKKKRGVRGMYNKARKKLGFEKKED
jgi:hypothetical protein